MYISPAHLPHAKLKPLASNAIQLENGFWQQWQTINQSAAIPHGYRMLEKTGTVNNMRIAAHQAQGEFKGYVFQDSDLYKWLEAASITLGKKSNTDSKTGVQSSISGLQSLNTNLQSLISTLTLAQFPNGYLDSYFTIQKPNQQWTDLEWAHEMYCAGHLIEAGIARKRATGDTDLLDIATRFADHIDATFGEGKRAGLCGHPEIELALVELYRETNEPRYLKLAQYFIDQRGHKTFKGLSHIGPHYMQDHIPVRDAQTVEGHAVRQLYLCAGVTDLYLETGETALLDAVERQWQDMTRGKMYLTGGVGARGYGEMFGDAYELPTKEAYCETCAAIAAMMWNWRLLLATNDAKYADALERVLYNGFLSGIALGGENFLYENPLRTDGHTSRQEWFTCACCPPNVMRSLALIEQYCATTNDEGVQIHQYMNAEIKGETGGWRLDIDYPWDGNVRVICEGEGKSELSLRIPAWSENTALKVNGENMPVANGAYSKIQRDWKRGDMVELELDMTPRFIQSHPYVDATRGSVAIERGPLVYCIEQQDQTADVNDLRINAHSEMRTQWAENVCGGVMLIQADGVALNTSDEQLYHELDAVAATPKPATITALPYYAWGNRNVDKMRVWIPTQ